MSPGSSTESYPAFARIGLRENPGNNLNQVTFPDRDSNPGHLVSQPDALTVTPQSYPRVPCHSMCDSRHNERIPNLSAEQSDGITVFRISPMASLMLHRCRTVSSACRGGGSLHQPPSVNLIGSYGSTEISQNFASVAQTTTYTVAMTAIDYSSSFVPISLQRDVIVVHGPVRFRIRWKSNHKYRVHGETRCDVLYELRLAGLEEELRFSSAIPLCQGERQLSSLERKTMYQSIKSVFREKSTKAPSADLFEKRLQNELEKSYKIVEVCGANVMSRKRRFRWEILNRPPYSPYLGPSDFHLFERKTARIVFFKIRSIKSRRLRWTGHVASMGESRNAYYRVELEGRREKDFWGGPDVDGRIILTWI
ncbi:hypothetical protein ANN_23087 [Periplaneta americana]|uniref:Uncharacterized protein n=1 Tax=Periplaneta americana TaxID=6978 RepID=A0ABQ8SL86_PERAM|nr:hypothetical protein ANN_23087 [Periplaneta americana]